MADFTVKEIADLLGVSKTTIQNAIKALSLECDYIEKTRQYYSQEKAEAIIRAVKPDFDLSQTAKATSGNTAKAESDTENQTAKPQNEAEKPPNQTDKPKTESGKAASVEYEALHRLIDLLEKQLEEKDKQIAVKDNQIADLSLRLSEAMQIGMRQQYITAKAITDTATEESKEQQAAEKKKKRSWFRKMFFEER